MLPEPGANLLSALQAAFGAALVDPGAEDAALGIVRGDPALARRRLALYRGNLRSHQEKALAGAYPVLKQQVGEEFFLGLAAAYGRAFPSQSGDLNVLGEQLPGFLVGFAPTAPYPWFPDLSRLEWALHCAHYASSAAPWTAADAAVAHPEVLERVVLRLHPACALVGSEWDIAGLWLAHQGPELGQWDPAPGLPRMALVFRPRWRVAVRALMAPEAAALQCLLRGATLSDALEVALDQDERGDPGALLAGWLAQGILLPPQDEPRL